MTATQTDRTRTDADRWPDPTPIGAPTPDHRRSTAVVGALLVTGGVVWLTAEFGLLDLGWQSLLAGALVVIGAGVLTLGLTGHGTGPLTAVGVIAVVVLAVTATTPGLVLDEGVGDRIVQPTSAAEIDTPYELGIGTLQVDLRDLAAGPGTTLISASVGVGELVVWVPEGITIVATADIGVGESTILGETQSGTSFVQEGTAGAESSQTFQLDLSVAIGSIEVRR